jgi:hypothetical protein
MHWIESDSEREINMIEGILLNTRDSTEYLEVGRLVCICISQSLQAVSETSPEVDAGCAKVGSDCLMEMICSKCKYNL